MKPQLAEDAIVDKVRYTCGVQPKIDGVRALNIKGTLTGRSLDPFEGFGITKYFSKKDFVGLDGEMILGSDPKADRLCSLTTGAMGRFKGVTEMADLHWWIFDYVTPATAGMPYKLRYGYAAEKLEKLKHERLHLVPMHFADNKDWLMAIHGTHLDEGYEGTIIRNLAAAHKEGRATQKGQELWRMKPWADAEMRVTGITEGAMNANEAKKNTLGRTERSFAKDGLIPNGQVGSIQGVMLADFYNPVTGKLMFTKGLPITIGTGKMTVKEAAHYFKYPDQLVSHIVKFQHMTHGVKDLPRFGAYISHRLEQDL